MTNRIALKLFTALAIFGVMANLVAVGLQIASIIRLIFV